MRKRVVLGGASAIAFAAILLVVPTEALGQGHGNRCQFEFGYSPNSSDFSLCVQWLAGGGCGNSTTETPFEECDAGAANDDAGDCTASCKLPVCDDGLVWNAGAGTEECDDGPLNADDADCTENCTAAVCGDGLVWNAGSGAEECDNGIQNGPNQNCLANCVLNVCGDGDVGPAEGCDDGGNLDGDGCSATCEVEAPPYLESGVYVLDVPIQYQCAAPIPFFPLYLVDIEINTFEIREDDTTKAWATPHLQSGWPDHDGYLSGDIDLNTGNMLYTLDMLGTCDEHYTLEATPIGPDQWAFTYTLEYVETAGAGSCFDCGQLMSPLGGRTDTLQGTFTQQ
jgi:cysteine-rich repeat protein